MFPTGSAVIAKKAGTLDFAIQAADLGVKLPVTVHLHGRAISADMIDYAIAESYPKIDLGGGHYLEGLDGHVYVLALPAICAVTAKWTDRFWSISQNRCASDPS